LIFLIFFWCYFTFWILRREDFPLSGLLYHYPAGWRWFKEEIHLSLSEAAFWCNINFCCNHNLVYLWRPKKWVSKCCLIPLYSQIFQSSKVFVFEQFKILSHRLCNLEFKCLRGECNFNYLDYSLEAIRSRNIKLLHYISNFVLFFLIANRMRSISTKPPSA